MGLLKASVRVNTKEIKSASLATSVLALATQLEPAATAGPGIQETLEETVAVGMMAEICWTWAKVEVAWATAMPSASVAAMAWLRIVCGGADQVTGTWGTTLPKASRTRRV